MNMFNFNAPVILVRNRGEVFELVSEFSDGDGKLRRVCTIVSDRLDKIAVDYHNKTVRGSFEYREELIDRNGKVWQSKFRTKRCDNWQVSVAGDGSYFVSVKP